MSSGLPINTFSQAREYRNRYLANLALEVQNDMMNLSANQVFRQTGQPSRPPDNRTTTEKLADLEGLKVSLRTGLMGITDGTQASETIEQLTPDEVLFASQQLPAITADLKPRFARGVPANALLNYIRALRRKELQTNGVSFTAQESTAQQILNAIQAGINVNGGFAGPIPGGQGNPINPPPLGPPGGAAPNEPPRPAPRPVVPPAAPAGLAAVREFKQDSGYQQAAAADGGLQTLEEWNAFPVPGGFEPDYPDVNDIYVEYLKMWARAQTPEIQAAFAPRWQSIKNVNRLKTALFPGWQLKQALLAPPAEDPNPFDEPVGMMPAPLPVIDIESRTASGIADIYGELSGAPVVEGPQVGIRSAAIFREQINSRGFSDKTLVAMLTQFMEQNRVPPENLRDTRTGRQVLPRNIVFRPTANIPANKTAYEDTNVLEVIASIRGSGMGPKSMVMRRPMEPSSRYPTGRAILGYGLSRGKSSGANRSEFVGMPVAEVSFSPFGKFIVNTNKLASNILDVRTQKGNNIPKYKQHQMSAHLAKTMKRIMGGRMIDEYDFNEMPLEDQTYLWNLAKDARIMDRLNLPTPKRTKDGEEENRFEILKGQIMAGNDSKELVKEFKVMLVKFSNDGRIKKNEARELLLDLASMGY